MRKPCLHADYNKCCFSKPCIVCALWQRSGSHCCGEVPIRDVKLFWPRNKKLSARKRGQARRLRRNPTRPEQLLWEILRLHQLGVRFSRQVILYGFIADFYCRERKLVVEVDGPRHGEIKKRTYDADRDAILWKKGRIRTVRLEARLLYWNPGLARRRIELAL